MRGRGSRGLIAALSLTALACSVPTGQAFSRDNRTMHDFKRMNFDDRAATCFALAEEIYQGVHPQRKIQGSLKMCQCLMAFADANAGSPAENERVEKAANLYSTAVVCARSQ